MLKGFDVNTDGRDQLSVSHILYADDTLVFCGAEENQLCQLRCILLCFEAVLGLKVNLSKVRDNACGGSDSVTIPSCYSWV